MRTVRNAFLRFLLQSLCVLSTLALPCLGQVHAKAGVAPTPPMGWNSWDSYGLTVDEAQYRANVDVLDAKLKAAGWNYAVIDEGWYLRNPLEAGTPEKLVFAMDANGRYVPAVERFPSATDGGFAALAKDVHARGLKLGIHIIRGIPRGAVKTNTPIAHSSFHAQDAADVNDGCPWNADNWGVRENAAGQAWYDSLIAQYAGWDVDYLKVDCLSDHPYRPGEIRMIARAIAKASRPMVLSLSPGPTSPALAGEVAASANLWRISDDVWDWWDKPREVGRGLRDAFPLVAAWAPFARPGAWPDADMLPLGHLGPRPGEGRERETRLTHDEQRTLLTLWSMARSPLVLGANLTQLDDWTLSLLTNRAVLAVDQHGREARQVAREGDMVAWTAKGGGGALYLAVFNLGDRPMHLRKRYDFFNLPRTLAGEELWTATLFGAAETVQTEIAPHGCALLLLHSARG